MEFCQILHRSPLHFILLGCASLLCLFALLGEEGPEELLRVNTQDVGDLIEEYI